MEEFCNIFGPELKAVTGDPKRIEDVLKRVDALIQPIESVSPCFMPPFASDFFTQLILVYLDINSYNDLLY